MNHKTKKFSKVADGKTTETSLQIVASIDDLLMQILKRVPIKPLIRFKLVSKHWNYLISSPKFYRLRNPNPNPAAGLFFECSTVNPRYKYVPFSLNKSTNILPFIEEPSNIRILESCNGLLLCYSFDVAVDNDGRYFVYNPTVNKLLKLPKLYEGDGILERVLGMSLAFDPSKSPHYKVVCVRGLIPCFRPFKRQFEVYSSETGGSWRKCGEPFLSEVNFQDGGVYWNGAIHWISHRGKYSLYFNPEDDEMPRVMPKLPISNDSSSTSGYYFGESCGHLHYVEILMPLPLFRFNVYEMRRDYSEWFVKYQIDDSPVVETPFGTSQDDFDVIESYWYYDLSVVSITTLVRGEKDENSFLVLLFPGKGIIRYNFVHMTCETIYEFENDEDRSALKNAFQYIESFF
ncbi:hypothetical protein DH2020_044053 [Rehmannia glutinosa]|uniref:F-box domain-containing protein n=1 Tax=Rehmannia glutinosa TaxID=99300 RepID=A0ABR0UJL7_REHGL